MEQLGEPFMAMKSSDAPVMFIDATHPTHNSKPAYGWIRKGTRAEIPANSGRQRLNLHGAVNAETYEVLMTENEKMTGESALELFRKIENQYQDAQDIYVILDRAPYYGCKTVKEYCRQSRIRLVYLPSYSPNLNIIEQLWRFMNEQVINNRFYQTFREFRVEPLCFFDRLSKDSGESKEFFDDLHSRLAVNFSIASDKETHRQVVV